MTVTVASLLAAAASSRKAAAAAAAAANNGTNDSNARDTPSGDGGGVDEAAVRSLNNNSHLLHSAVSARMGRRKQHCPQKTGLNADGKQVWNETHSLRIVNKKRWVPMKTHLLLSLSLSLLLFPFFSFW